MIVIAWVMFH